MPIKILELGKQFRPATNVVYPPFKNGRYMEEYFYDYFMAHKDLTDDIDHVYIPAFWTNLQIHPNFESMKSNYNILLKRAYSLMPPDTKYFTVVQHDLGVLLELPKSTKVFGACFGDVPLPLIYEDTTNKLENIAKIQSKSEKSHLASFVGTYTTHPLRVKMVRHIGKDKDFKFSVKHDWTDKVSGNQADKFIETTLYSKFCLAPRGYGRSSFRFFEAIQLNTIPVYFWDDVEWLPYKDIIDYSKFAVSIHTNNIPNTAEILKSITDSQYNSMLEELEKVKYYFTLEGMSNYIITYLTTHLNSRSS
jgi:hypothetical protein